MSISGSAIRAGRAFVELFADDKKLVRGLRRAERRLKQFGRSVTANGKAIFRNAAIALTPFVLSAAVFANFSDQMLKVKAVTAGTAAEFSILEDKAKELGRTTSFSASQVASGMVELGRAGFDRSQIDSAIAAVLDLSRATDTELPEAAAIAGASLRQFGLEAAEMPRVVDALTATANGSAQTLTDLGEALKPVAPIASSAGESIEQVSAAIAVLANNGIRGSLAGNSLARAYKNLSSDKVAGTLKSIGVNAVDANGNLRPMAEILNEVGRATKNMGSAQRLSIFEELFGRGQAAALKLADNTAMFDDLLNKIENSAGIAAQTAADMDSGLGGAVRRLLSAIEGIAIAIGDSIAPALMNWGDQLSRVSGIITKFIEKNKKSIASVFKWLVAIAGLGGGLVAFGISIQVVAFAIGGLATVVSGIASVLGIMMTVLGAIMSPLGIITIGFVSLAFSIEKATGIGRQAISGLGGMIQSLGGMVAETFPGVMKAFDDVGKTASDVFSGIRDAMASGDFALAAKILWDGLYLAFLQGTAPITELWNEVLYGLTDAWIVAWAGIKSIMIEASGFLQSAWQTTVTALAKQIVWLMSKVDKTIDVNDAYNTLNEQLNNKLKTIDSAREKSREANKADRDAMLSGSREVNKKRQEDARKEIEETRKKLDALIANSAAKAKSKEAERIAEKSQSPVKPGSSGLSLNQAGQKMSGTFSSLSSLMFGGVSNQVSADAKYIVEGQKKQTNEYKKAFDALGMT